MSAELQGKCKEAEELAVCLLSRITTLPSLKDGRRFYKGAILFYSVRGMQTLKAIMSLVKGGFGDQAMTVARTLVEMGINLVYMAKDPETRGKRFMEFDWVLRKKWLEKVRKHEAKFPEILAEANAQQIKEIEEGFQGVKKSFAKGRKDSWSGESIADMARKGEAGTEWFYDLVYALHCESSHNAVRKMTDYFEENPEGGISMKGDGGGQYSSTALAVSAGVLLIILSHLDEEFSLGQKKPIEELLKRIGG